MGLLCDFMYHGQVNVQQDRLPRFLFCHFYTGSGFATDDYCDVDTFHFSFLALASRLEVKGLTQTSEEKEKNDEPAAKVTDDSWFLSRFQNGVSRWQKRTNLWRQVLWCQCTTLKGTGRTQVTGPW